MLLLLLFTYHGTRIFRCDSSSKRRLVLLRKLSLVGFFFPSRSKSVSWRAEAHQVASPIREWSSFSVNPSCCFCDLVSVHHSPSGTASAPESWGAPTAPAGGGGAWLWAGGPPLVLSTLQLSVSSGLQLLRTPRLRGVPQPCACGPAASLSLFSLPSAEPRAHPLALLLTLHRALEKQSGVSPWDLFTLISILTIRFFTDFFSLPSLPSEPRDPTGRGGRKSNPSAQVPPSLKFPMILFSRILASESPSFGRQLPSR